MTSRCARLARLEKSFAPHVLASYRLVTHITVEQSDRLNGTCKHVPIAGSPIAELVVYAATRDGYRAALAVLRPQYTLLEG